MSKKDFIAWLRKNGRKGGRIGGKSRSVKKLAAIRENAKLGGRKRKEQIELDH